MKSLWLIALLACGAHAAEFQPAHSVADAQAQHEKLPTDDIWWTVNGRDMAWNFKNLHQIFPTVNVYRHGAVHALSHAPVAALAEFPVATPDGAMPFASFIESEHSTVMGVVVLHKGKIAFEAYPRMESHEKPVYWSVAKAFVGTLVRLLEERGLVDVAQPIEKYLPELADSALAGISVRNVLDMSTGLDCADEYDDKESCYYRYSMAIGDGFRTADAPDDPYAYATTLRAKAHSAPGERFSYSGLNTFVLAWLVEEILDMPFHDAFTKEIWWRLGAEADASYIAPINGVPVTHGGFIAQLRDVARFGLLFTPSAHREIVSKDHIAHLFNGANPKLTRGGRHNIYQWDGVFEDGTIFKGGWAGQGLVVNPRWDVVAVYTGYFKDDARSEIAAMPVIFEMLASVFGDPGE